MLYAYCFRLQGNFQASVRLIGLNSAIYHFTSAILKQVSNKGESVEETKRPNAAIVAIIVIVLVAAVAGGGYYLISKKDDASQTQETTSTTTQATDTTSSSTATYKDGTYDATGTYISPGGQESIAVELTLTNNVITAISATPKAASGESSQYQGEFISGYKSLVVGKNINDVKLSRVAGSSLTSTGFNDAIEQIKTESAA
jgi:type II secretory pathway pseudopilin PulG